MSVRLVHMTVMRMLSAQISLVVFHAVAILDTLEMGPFVVSLVKAVSCTVVESLCYNIVLYTGDIVMD